MSATPAHDVGVREPSWQTALSEAEAAERQLRLATISVERLVGEVRDLRSWDGRLARMEVARKLVDGSDGGPMTVLLAAASDPRVEGGVQRAASLILDRMTAALGLSPLAERGELLRLLPSQLAEFDVRGALPSLCTGHRSLYCVVRPGWSLDGVVLSPPLLELLESGSRPEREPSTD